MSFEPKNKRTRSLRALATLSGGIGLMVLLSGCSKVSGFGYQKDLSSVNETSISLWQGAWITAACVGLFTAGLILYSSFAHRKKEGEEFPRQIQYHIPVEVAYTLIPFIIVAVLFDEFSHHAAHRFNT